MDKPKKSYLKFVELPASQRKTKFIEVWSAEEQHLLGTISFKSQWRHYCFFPRGETVFDTSCLREIIERLEKEQAEWKSK